MNWQNILPIVLPRLRATMITHPLGSTSFKNLWGPFLQVVSAEDLLLLINNRKLDGKVVVKTNIRFREDLEDDDFKPKGIVFLVLDEDFAFKILTLGFLPEVNS